MYVKKNIFWYVCMYYHCMYTKKKKNIKIIIALYFLSD